MTSNSIFDRLTKISAFEDRYKELLIYSVSSQFPTLQTTYFDNNIDWSYLISCASLLSQSKSGKDQDITFRICQTCLSNSNCTNEMKSAAASILNILTNAPAVKLAKERHLITDNYLNSIPFFLRA